MTGPFPDHALLVRYLLGELPEEERLKIEQDCLANDELFEQLEAVEAELTDDYVRGALRGRQREEFEQRLLKTAQVDLSKLLISQSRPSRFKFTFSIPRLAFSMAAASLAILLGWFSLTHWFPKPVQPTQVAQRSQPPIAEPPIAQSAPPIAPVAPKAFDKRPAKPRPVTVGKISGAVVDASGAAIAQVRIFATNKTTGAVALSQSDSTGIYAFNELPAGDYALVAKAPGFQAGQLKAKVNPHQTVTENLALTLQSSTSTVEVTAAAPAVATTDQLQSTSQQASAAALPAPQRDVTSNSLTAGSIVAGNASAHLSTGFTRFQSALPASPQVTPANNAAQVSVNTSVVVQFTQPLAAVTVASANGTVAGTIATSTNRRFVTFAPAPGLSANTRYTVSVNGAVQSSFTTGASSDNTVPTIQLTSTSPRLVLQFSKPMDPASFNGIAASIQFSADLRTVTFTGARPITLTTAVKDIYGNSLPNQFTF